MDPVERRRPAHNFHRTDGVSPVEAEPSSGDFYRDASMDPVEDGSRLHEFHRTDQARAVEVAHFIDARLALLLA